MIIITIYCWKFYRAQQWSENLNAWWKAAGFTSANSRRIYKTEAGLPSFQLPTSSRGAEGVLREVILCQDDIPRTFRAYYCYYLVIIKMCLLYNLL